MPAFRHLLSRAETLHIRDLSTDNHFVLDLLIVILSLVFAALLAITALLFLRRTRRRRAMRNAALDPSLPQYNDLVRRPHSSISIASKRSATNGGSGRRLTIETRNGHSSVIVLKKGANSPMLANPDSPPHSPDNVPEIHITFPEEEDEFGKRHSGRVVVVRVGDNATVGLEPLHALTEEELPAYEKEVGSHFYSIDIDRIGGLKEKEEHIFV